MSSTFSGAHRLYVKSLYKRFLVNELNWAVRRDAWRPRAVAIRAEFERNRNVKDPRALAEIFAKVEAQLADKLHPDPYIRAFLQAITYTSGPHDLLSNSRDDGWWHKMVSLFDRLAMRPKYIDIRFVYRERNLPPPTGPIFDHEAEAHH